MSRTSHRRPLRAAAASAGVAALAVAAVASSATGASASSRHHHHDGHGHHGAAATPVKHLVVIFQENVSFDHYFATYPEAANTPGETLQGSNRPAPRFTAARSTPRDVATLAHDGLLGSANPNSVAPRRLTPGQAVTCDQDHGYTAEQKAYHGGAMDAFVENTSKDTCDPGMFGRTGLTMDYYDGNTVTGLWNYAQHYAMSDHSFSTTFGPSSPGAINLVSGNTHGVEEYAPDGTPKPATASDYVVRAPDARGVGTMVNDPDPVHDDCSNSSGTTDHTLAGMTGKNIGDLLGAKGVSWGWFQGGFRPSTPATADSPAKCETTHTNVAGVSSTDYNPHHEPFQYYASTANPHHLPPASTSEIGHDGQANHQYDISDFAEVVDSDHLPAVSFLKAPNYEDGHAAYSDPIDEQHFVVKEVNAIERSRNWKDTAVVIAYDDSDGWYDHVAATLRNASDNPEDDAAFCLDAAKSGAPVAGGYQDRCGPGPRQPLLVVSPFAKRNHVDHTQTQQASITRFVEDNWGLGRIGDHSADAWSGSLDGLFDFHGRPAPRVLLDPADGTVTSVPHGRDRRHHGHGHGHDGHRHDGHGHDEHEGHRGHGGHHHQGGDDD